MKIKLTLMAQADLSHIWEFTTQTWGEAQAETYIRNIWHTIETLKSNYNSSQNIDFIRKGYRKIQSASHIIFLNKLQTGSLLFPFFTSKWTSPDTYPNPNRHF